VGSKGIEEAVMDDPLTQGWRRSIRCSSGACVEIRSAEAEVAVRDSTAPGVELRFSAGAFRDFVERLKRA
jgi:hypothetical protein